MCDLLSVVTDRPDLQQIWHRTGAKLRRALPRESISRPSHPSKRVVVDHLG